MMQNDNVLLRFDDFQSTYLLKKKITLEKGVVVLGHEYSICPKVPLNRF